MPAIPSDSTSFKLGKVDAKMTVVPFLVCDGRETRCQDDTYPCDEE